MSPDKNLNEPKKLDTSSIKTTTLLSFLMYAMILVAFLWVLTSFFLDTYYQKMRTQEVIRTADAVEAQYLKGSTGFDKYVVETAEINGIYIQIKNFEETLEYNGSGISPEKAGLTVRRPAAKPVRASRAGAEPPASPASPCAATGRPMRIFFCPGA